MDESDKTLPGRPRAGEGFAVLAVLATQLLFGLSFLFTRQVIREVSTFSLLSWRFFAAFLTMNLLRAAGVVKIRRRGRSLKPLLLIGLFHPLAYYICETVGVRLTSASESGVMIATIPIVAMLFAALLLREYPTKLQMGAIILSVVGVAVVVLGKDSAMHFNAPGYLALSGAVAAGSLFYVFSRRAGGYTSVEKTYVMLGTGMVVFGAAALVEHMAAGSVAAWLTLPLRNGKFLWTLVYLGIVTSVAGSTLQNYGIAHLGVNRSAAFSSIATIVTIVAGVVFLGESFTLQQALGAALILLGVTGANWSPRKAGAQAGPDG